MNLRKRSDFPVFYFEESDSEVEEQEESVEDEEGEAEEAEEEVPPPVSGEVSSPSAAAFRSVCTSDTAKKYAIQFKVPPEYGLCAPTANQRAHDPPAGYAAVYLHHFQYGLRLPLHPLLVSLLDHYGIALAQVYPASVILVLGFLEICSKISIAPTPTLFRQFFRLGRCRRTVGWYTFRHCKRAKIVCGQPSGVHQWKEAFLFFKTAPLSSGNVALTWNHSPVVDVPLADNEKPSKEIVGKFQANVIWFPKHAYETVSIKRCSKQASIKPLESAEQEEMMVDAKRKGSCYKLKRAALHESEEQEVRMVESNSEAKRKRSQVPTENKFVDGSSQVFLARNLEEFASDIQEQVRLFSLKLKGEKEEMAKVIVALEQDLVDRNEKIATLQGNKEAVEKVVEDMEQSVKDKVSNIALLEREKEELKSENARIKSISDNEIARLKAEISKMKKASDAENSKFNDEISLLKSENSRIKIDSDNEIARLKAEISNMKSATSNDENSKLSDEISLLKSENSRLKSVAEDRGPLLKAYTWKLFKTEAFANFFCKISSLAQIVGRHDAAEMIRSRYPAIPEEALVGLVDPNAEHMINSQFFEMIQEDAWELPLLDHILSREEVPTSSELINIEVDEDPYAYIAPSPPRRIMVLQKLGLIPQVRGDRWEDWLPAMK